MTRINSLNQRYIKTNGEDSQEFFMVKKIMIKEIIKIDIGQIAEIEEHQTEVDVSMDKIIEVDHVILIIIERTIDRRDNFRDMQSYKGKKFEVDTEGIIEMIILVVVKVGLETDYIQIISE